ncbi:MAG TPA: hypothetical protein VMJ13_00530 [Candidatus Acidoferrum sp.]|jgi:hypothetical protein|nr:hypothetical protein [Candidatus Acidoferrum sp.]
MNCSYDVHSTYDIFRKLPDEGSVWVGAVKGEDRVRQVLISLKCSSPGAFFAWNASEGTVVELLVN